MRVAIAIFWALGFGLLAQSVAALVFTYNFLRHFRRSHSQPLNDFTPPVALIIPCKGLEPEFEANVSSYLGQDYPHYQAIFVVASVDDPAYPDLRTWLTQTRPGGVQTSLVVAGHSNARGEKTHNLLEGLKTVDAKAEVLVFADIDGGPKRDWLRSLVAPLEDPTVTVSTGSRWYLPGLGFSSRLRAVWGALDVKLLGEHEYNQAWGGSMAVRTVDFKRLAVAERYWANAVSDDDALTRAVHEAHGRIHFEPRCMVASRVEARLGEFLSWGTRQIIATRVYSPGLWCAEAGTYVYSCGTFLMGLIMLALPGMVARQRLLMAGILLVVLLLVMGKGLIHESFAKEQFPEEASSLRRYGACYWQLSLLLPWVVLLNYLLSCLTRRIEWRGTHYELRSRNETRVIRRGW